MKNKTNLNIKWLLLQSDQNADTTLLHSHDETYSLIERCSHQSRVNKLSANSKYPCKYLATHWTLQFFCNQQKDAFLHANMFSQRFGSCSSLEILWIESCFLWEIIHGLFHIKRTLLFSQRVKIQLLPIHSKHMVLWPSGCTKLSSKILEHGIIINILKSSLKFSMEKCTASGEDILFNNVNLATLKLWYASMKEKMVIWISLYYT